MPHVLLVPSRMAAALCLFITMALGARGAAAARATEEASPGALPGTLLAVDARTANDAWAVGFQPDPHDPDDAIPLVEHWDGSAWTEIPVPGQSSLTGVTALASNDVWAFGTVQTLHWDGTTWTVVDFPRPTGARELFVNGGGGVASNDLWMVGQFELLGDTDHMLIEHWNGSRWRLVRAPDIVGSGRLFDITAISANDAWAVGSHGNDTLTLHWNGSSWTVVATPSLGSADNALQDVSGTSTGDVWAVGAVEEGQPYKGKTVTEHWDGSQWARVTSPNKISADHLSGVTAIASNDVWAVGSYWPDALHVNALTMHYDGTRWTIVTAPPTSLNDVSGVSSNDVWAVSDVIEHWDGVRWSIVPASG